MYPTSLMEDFHFLVLAMSTWKWKSFHQHSINGESSSWLILLLQRLPQNQHNLQESYRSISFPLGYLLRIYPFLNFWSVVSGMSMFSLYFQFYSIQTWLLAWNGFTNSIELSNCLFPLPTLLHKIDSTSFNNSSSSLSGLYCHRFLARLLLPSWFWNRNKNVNIPEREGLFIELLCIEKYTS